MPLFESYERRINQINAELAKHGIDSIEQAKQICDDAGVDAYNIVKGIQPICFENAAWAYVVGCAIAIKDKVASAAEAAEKIGLGLQSFCIPGSVEMTVRLVLVTATWAQCFFVKKPSALHSWQVTNHLQLLKAL